MLFVFNVGHGQELHRLALEEDLACPSQHGWPLRGVGGAAAYHAGGGLERRRPSLRRDPPKRAARLISQPRSPELSQQAEGPGAAVKRGRAGDWDALWLVARGRVLWPRVARSMSVAGWVERGVGEQRLAWSCKADRRGIGPAETERSQKDGLQRASRLSGAFEGGCRGGQRAQMQG